MCSLDDSWLTCRRFYFKETATVVKSWLGKWDVVYVTPFGLAVFFFLLLLYYIPWLIYFIIVIYAFDPLHQFLPSSTPHFWQPSSVFCIYELSLILFGFVVVSLMLHIEVKLYGICFSVLLILLRWALKALYCAFAKGKISFFYGWVIFHSI